MSLIGVVSISLTASLFFLLQKNMAWIVTRFQGLLPCDVYTACKDFVPEFLVISVILTYFIYSFFFLRPFFIRRFRAWTDAEFVLYSLLMIVLTGLWFILSEVFDSGSELFAQFDFSRLSFPQLSAPKTRRKT